MYLSIIKKRLTMEKEKIQKICVYLDSILDVLELEKPNWESFTTDLEILNQIMNVLLGKIVSTINQHKMELKISTFNFESSEKINNKIMHYAQGAVKAVKAMTLPETEESKARLVVCRGCDKWTGSSCKVCGCYVNLKVKISEEKCPEGKW